MDLFYAFLFAYAVSLVGSLQPGPVNLAVISGSIQQKNRNALLIAIGGSWPEFVFCFIAIKASCFILEFKPYFFYFQLLLILVFLVAGIYLLLSKKAVVARSTKYNGFKLGTFLGLLNPQLILFWTAIVSYVQINNLFNIYLIENNLATLLFCLGASLGAFSLHLFLIFFVKKFVNLSIHSLLKYADKFIAIIFIILALVQFIKITQ